MGWVKLVQRHFYGTINLFFCENGINLGLTLIMGHYLLSNRGKLRRTGSYRRFSGRLIAFLGTKPVIFLLQNGLFILPESGY